MFTRTTSIRGKIVAGYLVSFAFLLAIAAILFATLLGLEDKVRIHFGVSRFLDATLEMRRYEKNFLLYGRQQDLGAALEYAGAARALLDDVAREASAHALRRRWLRFVPGLRRGSGPLDTSADETRGHLVEYVELLERARQVAAPDAALEAAVREHGRHVTDIAERLSAVEARNVQETLRGGRSALLVLVGFFLLGTALIARVVARTAIQPLMELERGMQRIASGDFRPLPVATGNDEIDSMNGAFNRMIHEVLEHRQERIQSERLAALGTMLAGIAHEINNPLSNVSTSAEILREENERAGTAERRELIEQIVSQTDRATAIIRTVLDYTRAPRLERRPTNLLSAVQASVALVRGRLPGGVRVELDVPADLEVAADAAKLEQGFINVLSNAIDATRGGGREGRIAVTARRHDGQVEVAFRDSGPGIPEAVRDRIFDPFFTTKDVGHGTGLGLYLTRQIVEQHGGAIRVESGLGQGTTVLFSLPACDPGAAVGSP